MTNAENRILIISGGHIDDTFLSELTERERYSMIIAADKGLAAADRLELPLDLIVGDFDSVPEDVLARFRNKSTPIKTFPKEKDKTDTQIAIELALNNNPTAIDIVGATGCRMDHVLANIHLLLLPLRQNVHANILDLNNRIYLMDKSFSIHKTEQYGGYVSLLPFTEKVAGLTLKGFKYPLDHVLLNSGNSIGISNEIKEDIALVEFSQGILVVMETKD